MRRQQAAKRARVSESDGVEVKVEPEEAGSPAQSNNEESDDENIKTEAIQVDSEEEYEETPPPSPALEDGPYHILNLGNRQLAALDSGFLTDVTITVGEEAIKCHSVIVSFASRVLAALIIKEKEPRLPDINPRHFHLLLRIIYGGQVSESSVDTLLQVGRLAHDLKVHTAVDVCAKCLAGRVKERNLWDILNFAYLIDNGGLEIACFEFIRCKAGSILKNNFFLKFGISTMEMFLKQDRLYNVKELRLFQACVAWADADSPREGNADETECQSTACEDESGGIPLTRREALVHLMLPLIRFRLFSAQDFAKHVCPTKLLSAEEQNNIFRSLATGENFMPEGFSTSTSLRDPVGKVMDIDFASSHERNALGEFPKNANMVLAFSSVKNIFIVGVKLRAWRANLPPGTIYDENVVVSLQQKMPSIGILERVVSLKKVKKGDMLVIKFRHPVEIMCNAIYTLEVAYSQSDRENLTYDLYKQVLSLRARRLIRIDALHEFVAPPDLYLLLADKVTACGT